MNTLMNGLKNATNYAVTENGALTHKTTRSDLLDMFAMGAAMRSRSDEDVITMFNSAYKENPEYALKCLFYIRDARGGQGERRFFRVIIREMSLHNATRNAIKRNLEQIPVFGRWDDLFAFDGTPLMDDALRLIQKQLALDIECQTPSLLAKWMPSENTSSSTTVKLANRVRKFLGLSHREYRKILSLLRGRLNVLEKLMSENRWDEIEFDKIPSRAGLIYKNAFARRDILRDRYEAFMADENTKVNAGALYPYEVVRKALDYRSYLGTTAERNAINKYWDNLTDYFKEKSLNALCVVDTSGSMTWAGGGAPIQVAISLGMYCAERAGGPFANHYISFASRPQLIEIEGRDFVDKVQRIERTNLCDNTNIEAVFDLLLRTMQTTNCPKEDLPENILIISDMEFDEGSSDLDSGTENTLMENIYQKWNRAGYQMPHLIYWNVNARQDNIPQIGQGRISYVSGFSPSLFESIISGKSGYELMMECLNKKRYADIH